MHSKNAISKKKKKEMPFLNAFYFFLSVEQLKEPHTSASAIVEQLNKTTAAVVQSVSGFPASQSGTSRTQAARVQDTLPHCG